MWDSAYKLLVEISNYLFRGGRRFISKVYGSVGMRVRFFVAKVLDECPEFVGIYFVIEWLV